MENNLICNFSDLELNQKTCFEFDKMTNYRSIYLIELFSEATEIYVEEQSVCTVIRLNNNGLLQKISLEQEDYEIYSNHSFIIFSALKYAQKCQSFSYISKINFWGHSHINFYDMNELPPSIKKLHLESDTGLSPDVINNVTSLTINYYTSNLTYFPKSLKKLSIIHCNDQFKDQLSLICKKMEISLSFYSD